MPAVNCVETEPVRKMVAGPLGTAWSRLAPPWPAASIRRPSRITAREQPGPVALCTPGGYAVRRGIAADARSHKRRPGMGRLAGRWSPTPIALPPAGTWPPARTHLPSTFPCSPSGAWRTPPDGCQLSAPPTLEEPQTGSRPPTPDSSSP